jgi:hypothetical protein
MFTDDALVVGLLKLFGDILIYMKTEKECYRNVFCVVTKDGPNT